MFILVEISAHGAYVPAQFPMATRETALQECSAQNREAARMPVEFEVYELVEVD